MCRLFQHSKGKRYVPVYSYTVDVVTVVDYVLLISVGDKHLTCRVKACAL